MENLNLNYTELGLMVGVIIALVRLLEKGLSMGYNLLKNGKTDNKQDITLAVLKEKMDSLEINHLPHIQKQLEKNEQEHEKMINKIDAGFEKLTNKIDNLKR